MKRIFKSLYGFNFYKLKTIEYLQNFHNKKSNLELKCNCRIERLKLQ
jgi:hypothetical protein